MLLTPSEIKYIQDFQAFTKGILARAQRAGERVMAFCRHAGKFCRRACRRTPLIPHYTLYANLKQMSSTYLVSYD